LQKLAHQRIAAAGNQGVMPKHGKGDVEIGICGKLDEGKHGLHVMLRDEAAETGRGEEDNWLGRNSGHAWPEECGL